MRATASRGLACAVVLSTALSASAQRRPYLQLGTETSMTIVWETPDDSPTAVCYGASPDALTNRAGTGRGRSHQVRVEGLSPGTQYFYSVSERLLSSAGRGQPRDVFPNHATAGLAHPVSVLGRGRLGDGRCATARGSRRNA